MSLALFWLKPRCVDARMGFCGSGTCVGICLNCNYNRLKVLMVPVQQSFLLWKSLSVLPIDSTAAYAIITEQECGAKAQRTKKLYPRANDTSSRFGLLEAIVRHENG